MKKALLLITLGFVLGSAAGGYGGYLAGEFLTWRRAIEYKVAYYDPSTGVRKWGSITVVEVEDALPKKATKN